MAKITWSFLDNPFDNRTKRNFKRMYAMATDHFDKLKEAGTTDASLQAIYDFGLPAFKTFIKVYEDNKFIRSDYRYQTLTLENLFADLSSKLARRWDISIQVEYDIDTAEYQSLMAGKRSIFQRGSYDMRIAEVKALARRLTGYPNLAALQEEVAKFAARIDEVRSVQQGKEGSEQRLINDLEVAREELAEIMQGMCYQLCVKYYNALYKVENFYELKYLRRTPSKGETSDVLTLENLPLLAGEVLQVFTDGEIKGGDTVQVINSGNVAIEVGLAGLTEAPTTVPVGNFVSLGIPEDATVQAVVLQNPDSQESGEVTVKVL